MELFTHVVLLLHFLGWAAFLGGLLAQLRTADKKITSVMRDGIGTAVVAGVVLTGLMEASADPGRDHAWVGIKLVVGVVLLVLTMMNLRKEKITSGLFNALLALTVLNMVVAIFWE